MNATFSRACVSLAILISVNAVTAVVSGQSPGEWKPLFNGTDLTGWTVAAGRGGANAAPTTPPPPPPWKVENGVLIGGQGGRGSLVTADQYKDFELEMDFALAEHGSECSEELLGPDQKNGSKDPTCLYNSGITFRTGYQLNIGRREAGEYIGIVVHRQAPGAIRGNVLWLDKGDAKFPGLRKKQDWNTLRISAKGPHLQVFMNGTKICDVTDNPTDPAEAKWKEAGPISIQSPYTSGFEGFVKYRNVRIRTL
jgi:3-keto-disaccharide hydrolase